MKIELSRYLISSVNGFAYRWGAMGKCSKKGGRKAVFSVNSWGKFFKGEWRHLVPGG